MTFYQTMELFEAIKKRHMCRNIDPKKDVADKVVDQIIDAGEVLSES